MKGQAYVILSTDAWLVNVGRLEVEVELELEVTSRRLLNGMRRRVACSLADTSTSTAFSMLHLHLLAFNSSQL